MSDKLKPSVYGVGFFGFGDYNTRENGSITKQYMTWSAMIRRCYSPEYLNRRPNYINVTVCAGWLNFQVFAKWFDENSIPGYQMDKDIKQRGVAHKVYSPSTCHFVSGKDNTIESVAKTFHFISPSGVDTEIYNLLEYCADKDIDRHCMYQLHSGVLKKYKGWVKNELGDVYCKISKRIKKECE